MTAYHLEHMRTLEHARKAYAEAVAGGGSEEVWAALTVLYRLCGEPYGPRGMVRWFIDGMAVTAN